MHFQEISLVIENKDALDESKFFYEDNEVNIENEINFHEINMKVYKSFNKS